MSTRTMVRTEICRGDKVVIIQGEGKNLLDREKKQQVLTVLKVDRVKGRVYLEVQRPKAKRGEREQPVRGVEQWKTVRYNPQSGEAGGMRIVKKPVHISNVKVVEKGPRRGKS